MPLAPLSRRRKINRLAALGELVQTTTGKFRAIALPTLRKLSPLAELVTLTCECDLNRPQQEQRDTPWPPTTLDDVVALLR
jgi:hypothetical protein